MPSSNRHWPASAGLPGGVRPAAGAFALVAGGFLGMMAGAGAPSPVYRVYQREWGYSPSIVAVIFVVYVVALLAALLLCGELSDRLGRRRVLVAGLVALAGGMVLFACARGLSDLLLARVVQGFATGTATGAFSASVIELQPPDRPQRGSFVTAVAPTLGPGTGALLSALLVQFAPWPRQTVFVTLGVVYLIVAVLISRLDAEPLDVRRPARGGPRFRFELPHEFRRPFLRFAPTLVAAWSVGGLFLALAPSFMPVVFGVRGSIVGALTIFVLLGAGAGAASLLQRQAATAERTIVACGGLAVGTVVLIAGVATRSTTVFLAGCLVAGIAFGAALFLATAVLGRAIPPERRSGVLSVIFVVNYVAFALPPLLAGVCATRFGFVPTLLVYLSAAAGLCVIAAASLLRRGGDR